MAQVGGQVVAEIASIRLRVEPYAGELSMDVLRGQERSTLVRTMEDLNRATEANDIPASIDAHLRFHRLLYDFSGNGILQDIWNGWESKLRLYLAADHRTYSDVHDIAREHEGMVRYVLDGDVDGFRHDMARHFPTALSPGSPASDAGDPVLSTVPLQSVLAADIPSTTDKEI